MVKPSHKRKCSFSTRPREYGAERYVRTPGDLKHDGYCSQEDPGCLTTVWLMYRGGFMLPFSILDLSARLVCSAITHDLVQTARQPSSETRQTTVSKQRCGF
jgi:hypothetical protein